MRNTVKIAVAALALLGVVAAGGAVTSQASARGEGEWPVRNATR